MLADGAKVHVKCIFPKIFSVILDSSYQADVCSSVHFFDKFGFPNYVSSTKWRRPGYFGFIFATCVAVISAKVTVNQLWLAPTPTWTVQFHLPLFEVHKESQHSGIESQPPNSIFSYRVRQKHQHTSAYNVWAQSTKAFSLIHGPPQKDDGGRHLHSGIFCAFSSVSIGAVLSFKRDGRQVTRSHSWGFYTDAKAIISSSRISGLHSGPLQCVINISLSCREQCYV